MLTVADFDFDLPEELIAQNSLAERDTSRMMVINSKTGEIELTTFNQITNYLNPNDLLVFNDTKVIPARVFGNKVLPDGSSGAKIEALLLDQKNIGVWESMIRPGKRVKVGTKVSLSDEENDYFQIKEKLPNGNCLIEFPKVDVLELLDKVGHMPLPPYIKRDDTAADRDKYQTIFADKPGAVAAPTASLHFTDRVLSAIKGKGVNLCNVTLHVGAGTFQPVKVDNIDDHQMHTEQFFMSEESAEVINKTKASGGRVFAAGTTSVRVLESCAQEKGRVEAGTGRTDIFIYPPYEPKIVDCLLTNFHLPKSTLLMLVSALAGKETIMKAYKKAVDEKFRFFSYGDCMLII